MSLKGLCMGASDVIPGVSGGTMAFILGIYEELIYSIRSLDLPCLKLLARLRFREFSKRFHWEFLLAVGAGIAIAILSLARVLAWLLENRPVLIWSFFFGLISASVFTVSRRVKQWDLRLLVFAGLGAAAAFWVVGLIPTKTPDAPWYLFLSGAVAICAMILPGISGAFILVLLGKYQMVLQALNNREFTVLFLVAAGACVGIVLFSRVLNWFFTHHHDLTVALLTGFMLGSLRKIWPWKETVESLGRTHGQLIQENVFPRALNHHTALAMGLMALGCLVVLLLDRLAHVKEKPRS
ncbi:MAG: DUF368 domain-containing protein [Deltaproteobacteria bacterium]|nr:DUF368 domain-containing protein [Deltaproteobacteria bacterium]MBW1927926.1 DUF368 domain-containing protein [Deltaproteobacteria bacterium]MBW2024833.1 DUF368 domain-containing protein [Deltaproteobacteria bacterium]MBW2124731.1 DUF368 domain-containing protein [Deltaproteobacteria bacterium]RLB14992.1 MAG: DUF368 domain-containing protein [Deltaproteobacteria bacterium]